MTAPQADSVVLAVCLVAVAVSGACLWLLGRPASWLSKRVDRAVTLPADDRRVTR